MLSYAEKPGRSAGLLYHRQGASVLIFDAQTLDSMGLRPYNNLK